MTMQTAEPAPYRDHDEKRLDLEWQRGQQLVSSDGGDDPDEMDLHDEDRGYN